MKTLLLKIAFLKTTQLKNTARWLIAAVLCCYGLAVQAQTQQLKQAALPKVLLIASSYGVADDPTKPGTEFDEYAIAYQLLSPYVTLELASPKGGEVIVSKYNSSKPYNAFVLASPEAMQLLAASKKISEVNAGDYQAVLVLGGKGPMFDLVGYVPLQQLLADMAAEQKIIAAICHGPVALLHVKNPDGSLLLQGKKVAGFSNREETMFSKEILPLLPFLLEDGLTKAGAVYQEAEPMLPLVVQDGLLITGQNPYSTPGLVDAMLSRLQLKVPARQAYPDEKALSIVQQFIAGQPVSAPFDDKQVDTSLMGMWGYYALQFATSQPKRQQAVQVMELVSDSFTHPQFLMALAEGQWQLGNKSRAVELAKAVLKQQPDSTAAQQLLHNAEG